MYEVIKVVNGTEIIRMKGAQKHYYINVGKNKQKCFKTIKSATEYAKEVRS